MSRLYLGNHAFGMRGQIAGRGFFATKNFVYELGRFDIVAPTMDPSAEQMPFACASAAARSAESGTP